MGLVRRGHAVILLVIGMAGCGGGASGATWAETPPPQLVGETDDVVVDDGSLADGRYWGTVQRVSGSDDLIFRVAKARFGDTCEAWMREEGIQEACLNDYHVDQRTEVYVQLDDDAVVTLAAIDATAANFAVDVDELESLIEGGATGAPPGYQWTPFPFVVTVANGEAVRAEQHWVP